MIWPYPHLPGKLFCAVPYGSRFLDNKGNAWEKKSGLKRRNAILLKAYGGQYQPKEAFFSATAKVLPLIAVEEN